MKFRIKEICKEKGILMESLAEMLSIHPTSLTRNIKGNPTIETLERIAAALNVPIIDLFQAPASGNIVCPECGAAIKLTASSAAASSAP